MARIDYGDVAAAAFQSSRELPPGALGEWRAAITRHLAPRPGMQVLDLGAGTGTWAATLAAWYDVSVVAVEPSAAMRARSRYGCMLAGQASVRAAFAAAGFSYLGLEPVRQRTAPSLAAIAATMRRESHTPLMLITDRAYQAGLTRLRAAPATQRGPVIDTLDLLVLRADRSSR